MTRSSKLKTTPSPRTGWSSWLTRMSLAAVCFLTVSGLLITLAPFVGVTLAAVQWSVLVHTGAGLLVLVPLSWYFVAHWRDYKGYSLSDEVLLGYVAVAALLICSLSGVVLTWQGLFGVRTSALWRSVHLYSTLAALLTAVPHVALVFARRRRKAPRGALWANAWTAAAATVVGTALIFLLAGAYSGAEYVNEFPDDYSYLYGEDRPFAPSLATTETGGALDADSLAGSRTCGTAGCHSQILEEWLPSAHRYSAMDPLFQKVQSVMAEQNGPSRPATAVAVTTRSRSFRGPRTSSPRTSPAAGLQRRDLVPVCHGVRETDLQGNANYVMTQPPTYLWQWREDGAGKFVSDFPDPHLSGQAQRAQQAYVQGARVLRRLPQAVHRPGGQPRRLGAAAEPVRQLEGQPLVRRRRPDEDRRMPGMPHAAGRVDRPGPRRPHRLQPRTPTTAGTAVTASSPPTAWCRRCWSWRAGRRSRR